MKFICTATFVKQSARLSDFRAALWAVTAVKKLKKLLVYSPGVDFGASFTFVWLIERNNSEKKNEFIAI